MVARSTTFTERVRYIIDREHQGNVSEAARKIGVSQRGLAKVYSEETPNPGVALASSIVRAYPDVDAHWVLTGQSRAVGEQLERSARTRAADLLRAAAEQLATSGSMAGGATERAVRTG